MARLARPGFCAAHGERGIARMFGNPVVTFFADRRRRIVSGCAVNRPESARPQSAAGSRRGRNTLAADLADKEVPDAHYEVHVCAVVHG